MAGRRHRRTALRRALSVANGWLPRRLAPQPTALLPADPRTYDGPRLARWAATAYLVAITTRSLVHLLSPDGGAASIAGIDLSVGGAANIVAIFGQWGAIQLLLAGLLWVLLLRWPGTTPLVLLVFCIEPVLRQVSGLLKPVTTLHTAPGVALNGVVLPVMAVLLVLSLCPAREDRTS